MTNFNLTIEQDDHDRRIDRILRKAFKDFPLSFIHRLIRKKRVLINNIPAKAETKVHRGDVISIKGSIVLPDFAEKTENAINLPKPDILYENADLLIVNKPAGIDVHGTESLETLVHAYLKDTIPSSVSFKPGPLHRLDKPTSGIIAFSKSLEGARSFSEALQNGKVKKQYLALLDGIIEEKYVVWEDFLVRDKNLQKTFAAKHDEGQNAVMKMHPLQTNSQYTLALIELVTGRTHQIRAQSSIHHHPLAGDKKYGGSFLQGGFFLHAWRLSIPLSIAPDFPSLMTSPIPSDKETMLTSIFGNKIENLYQNFSHESPFNGII
jgi:23S rRNA pseudouridine955/2504/2580 synthase